jgi:hypothetical protein
LPEHVPPVVAPIIRREEADLAVVPGYLLDGTKCYVVEGEYGYELRAPYKETDPILLGAMPYSSESASANALSPAAYSKVIIGPNVPPAGAPADAIIF